MDSIPFIQGDKLTAAELNVLRRDIAKMSGDYGVTAGSGNNYTLTLDGSITSYSAGMIIKFRADRANSGASTININSIGEVPLRTNRGRELRSATLLADSYYEAIYDGTSFILPAINDLTVRHSFVSAPLYDYDIIFETANGLKLICLYNISTIHEYARSAVGNFWAGYYTNTYSAYYAYSLYEDNGTEYLLGANNAATRFVRYLLGNGTATNLDLHGSAPANYSAHRAYCREDGYIYQLDTDTSSKIRRYTISGTDITNIDSDITLSDAPASARAISVDNDYIYIEDYTNSILLIRRYVKSTGALIENNYIGYNYYSSLLIGRDRRLSLRGYSHYPSPREFLPIDLPI